MDALGLKHMKAVLCGRNREDAMRREEPKIKSGNKKTAMKAVFLNLAPQPGLEPGTYGLTVRCSTN